MGKLTNCLWRVWISELSLEEPPLYYWSAVIKGIDVENHFGSMRFYKSPENARRGFDRFATKHGISHYLFDAMPEVGG